MKRAAPSLDLDQLVEQINAIVLDRRLVFNQKVKSIFEIGKQASDYLNNQTLWLKKDTWNALKKEIGFWETVIEKIQTSAEKQFLNLGAVNEKGNLVFGMAEIANILGNTTLTDEITKALLLHPDEKQKSVAQRLFINYIRWHDKSPMCFGYVALYARYLAITGQLVPLEIAKEHRDSLPLTTAKDVKYAFVSYLAVTASVTVKNRRETGQYLFTQEKDALLFTITIGDERATVETQGTITRMIKFVYNFDLMLVLSGPRDNKLVRLRLDRLDSIEVISPFVLDPDLFEDLLHIDLDKPHRFASHMKAIVSDSPGDLKAFDCARLSKVKEPNFAVDQLFHVLQPSSHHIYQPANKNAFSNDDLVMIANRTIAYPYGEKDYCMAVLVKRYTSDPNNPFIRWRLELRLYKYVMEGPFPTKAFVTKYKILRLDDNFLSRLANNTLREFNIIFHTKSIFYVEALLRVSATVDGQNRSLYEITNSRLFNYAFEFQSYFDFGEEIPPDVSLEGIKDAQLFELVRKKGYRVYDFFRHAQLVDYEPKYECLFYKHDYEKKYSRFIFYKARDTQPGVANLTFRQMSPYSLSSLFPVPNSDILGVLSVNTEEFVRKNLVVSPAPVVFRILEQDSFSMYEPQQFSLDSRFAKKLTLGDNRLVCVLCVEENVMKDSISGNLYCDELCQRIFCKTNRL